MTRRPATGSAFLSAMKMDAATADAPVIDRPIPIADVPRKQGRPKKASGSRDGLKHIGGYLHDDAAERFARLKIRTRLGNDELLTLAIDELWRTEGAKRKWDD